MTLRREGEGALPEDLSLAETGLRLTRWHHGGDQRKNSVKHEGR